MPLAGSPMVEWSIEAFRAASSVGSIVVAVPPREGRRLPWDEQMLGRSGVGAVEGGDLDLVDGGATRAQSVSHALETVRAELVAIHDAARPLVTPELIEGVVATLLTDPDAAGAIAATPVTDTIKRVGRVDEAPLAGSDPSNPSSAPLFSSEMNNGALVEKTLDRGRLWAAQTPQVFWADALRAALAGWSERAGQVEAGAERPLGEATDEAMLVEAAGGKVLIHPSSAENLKVTTPLDLRVAELLLSDAPDADDRRGGAARRE